MPKYTHTRAGGLLAVVMICVITYTTLMWRSNIVDPATITGPVEVTASNPRIGIAEISKKLNVLLLDAPFGKEVTLELPEQVSASGPVPPVAVVEGNSIRAKYTKAINQGSYELYLEGQKQDYLIQIRTINSPIDLAPLEQRLQSIISPYKDNTSYALYDLKRGIALTHRGEELFPPGSVTKLPYAILVMKDVQNGLYTMDRSITVTTANKAYRHDIMYGYASGRVVSLRHVLGLLYQQSDNTAMIHIESMLGGYARVQERIRTELGIDTYSRNPNAGSSVSTYKLLNLLYSPNGYLNDDSRGYLRQLLIDCNPIFWNRIRGGIPRGITVANKIGNIGTARGVGINDSAIIYGNTSDYIFVVLTRDYPSMPAAEKIQREIGRAGVEFFENAQ